MLLSRQANDSLPATSWRWPHADATRVRSPRFDAWRTVPLVLELALSVERNFPSSASIFSIKL
jgi:hypothetical protein